MANKPNNNDFLQFDEDVFIYMEKYKNKKLKNYWLIEGFPGIGLIGTIAAKYIIDYFDMKEIGHIESNSFLPIVRIHKGLPVYPARFYIDEKRKLVVLISEQMIGSKLSYFLAKKTIDWIRAKKINNVISLSGLSREYIKNVDEVYGFGNNEKALKLLKKHSIKIIEEGISTGITALMISMLKHFDNIKAISLMAAVSYQADYKASALLIKKLNEILSLNINVEPLYEEAKKAEKAIIEHLKQLQKTKKILKKIEELNEREDNIYRMTT